MANPDSEVSQKTSRQERPTAVDHDTYDSDQVVVAPRPPDNPSKKGSKKRKVASTIEQNQADEGDTSRSKGSTTNGNISNNQTSTTIRSNPRDWTKREDLQLLRMLENKHERMPQHGADLQKFLHPIDRSTPLRTEDEIRDRLILLGYGRMHVTGAAGDRLVADIESRRYELFGEEKDYYGPTAKKKKTAED